MEENNIAKEVDVNEIIKARQEKLARLIEMDKNPYEIVKFDKDTNTCDIKAKFDEFEGKTVKIAGRMMSRRVMGKASFANLLDGSGNIQLYVSRGDIGEDEYVEFKKYDIGDIIGVTGMVFTTKTGEISIHTNEIELLSKSLLPLPEKYHGLKDTDTRYRQRYVDLIANPDVKKTFVTRSKIITAIRSFLDNRDFLEVETPILNTVPGGASARPFVTHHNTLDLEMYMRIAPELYLKRLIVGGFERVYEIGRLFRNEGMDSRHNPEFTTVELYQAYTDYHGMMDLTEEMFNFIADNVIYSKTINYQGVDINIGDPWKRITMVQAVCESTGIDFDTDDMPTCIAKAKAIGIELKENISWGKALYQVFDLKVESQLIQPTFITDYPVEVSPLAKRKKSDPRLTERFEFFITSREMGNAFSELNDPIDQKARFLDQVKEREDGDDEAQMMDEDFVTALEYGMPPTGGLGIGIDRLVMLFTDESNIRDVLLFPTMKPLL